MSDDDGAFRSLLPGLTRLFGGKLASFRHLEQAETFVLADAAEETFFLSCLPRS